MKRYKKVIRSKKKKLRNIEDSGSKGETEKSINIRSKMEINIVGIKQLSKNEFDLI